MGDARRQSDLARMSGIARTIPNEKVDVNVTASSATFDLANLGSNKDPRGSWVMLRARGTDITIRRGSHTLTAGQGLTIYSGSYEEFFIPQGSTASGTTTTVSVIGTGSGVLEILYDSEA